ncbi:MAG: ribosome biogenesis GTP-binding protein YihA/YsxC [Christensenellaceae bacterium]|jgi:GTP-binding protein|nr:ribosome biogenesis GTP-binding protein YihA/YsxC [Christensenellaceae bacterium]
MQIRSAEFVTSVADRNFYKSSFKEVAFAGRSNAGKSSLINALTQKKLAKTSNTPGRTRLINYFLINKEFLLVDLPGYGYAEAPKKEQKKWGILMEEYLKTGANLKCVYILLDIRREPSEKDIQMIKFLYFYNIPFVFVVTKADKVSRSQQNNRVTAIISALGITKSEIIITSSETGQGMSELWADIERRKNSE